MPASLLISMAEKQTDFDEDLNVMQLDDNCTVDEEGSVRLRSYRIAYRDLASEMGVRLASEDNRARHLLQAGLAKS